MDKVKKLIRAGASIPGAIRVALGEPLSVVAERRGIERARLSAAINGIERAREPIVAALVAELGGTPDEWRELLWLAGKPARNDVPAEPAVA